MVSLTSKIMVNKSTLTFRCILPQKTGKSFKYTYQELLMQAILRYFKKNVVNWRSNVGKQRMRFFETYENGFSYLNCKFEIYNKRGIHKIIEVND